MHTKPQELSVYQTRLLLSKIIAICWGLAVASLVLLFLYFFHFSSVDPFIFIDNQFFGKVLPSVFSLIFYLLDIIILSLVIWFSEKNGRVLYVALPWFAFNFLETLSDIYFFRYDPHFILEEFVFLSLYFCLVFFSASLLRRGVSVTTR